VYIKKPAMALSALHPHVEMRPPAISPGGMAFH
jgi:hypothetical protein